jgi:serine/threonine protein kinase
MRAGQRLSGRYALEALLGSGGMGEVWRAWDRELDRPVAVKVLREEFAGQELAERFRREARIAGRLQHPGITVVHDVGSDNGRLFMVMELLHGRDLEAVLARASGGLPVGAAVSLAVQAAGALQAAHAEHVVHRDLKPANLFLLDSGQLKLCDFGIARAVDATAGLTLTGHVLGTPSYMSPEQCQGKQVDERSDLYSLGCVLYALLAGRPPFGEGEPLAVMFQHLSADPPPLRTMRPDVPQELDRLVVELLAKDPARRPADASHVTAALQAMQHAAMTTLPAAVPSPTEQALPITPHPRLAHVFERPSYGVSSMAWQPHGELLATGNGDLSVTLFNGSTGHEEGNLYPFDRSLGILQDPVSNWIYWSPDGRYLASWQFTDDGHNVLAVWDSRTRTTQFVRAADKKEWNSVSELRDGLMRAQMGLVAYQDGGELSFKREVLQADGSGGPVRLLSRGPRWSVASSDSEKGLLLGKVTSAGRWDGSNGARLLIGHRIASLAWSSDGMRLAVYGDIYSYGDGRIEIWNMGPERLVRRHPTTSQ